MLFLALKKGSNSHYNSLPDCHSIKKILPLQNFPLPHWGNSSYLLTLFGKIPNCPFAPKENLGGKLTNVSITFVYLLCPIMLKCFRKNL